MLKRTLRSLHCQVIFACLWLLKVSHRRPYLVLFLYLTSALFFGYHVRHLQFRTGNDQFISSDMEVGRGLLDYRLYFDEKMPLYLLLQNPNGFSYQELCQIRDRLTKSSFETKEVSAIQTAFQLRKYENVDGVMQFSPILNPDCQGDFLSALQTMWRAYPQEQWIGQGQKDFLILFLFDLPSQVTRFGQFDPTLVDHLKSQFHFSEYQMSWYGPAELQSQILKSTKTTQIVNLLAVSFVLILMWLIYQSYVAPLLFGILIFYVNLIVHGMIAVHGDAFETLTQGVVLLLTIAALEDFIFVCLKDQLNRGSWRLKYKKVLTGSFYTSLTTAVGFASLCISDIQAIRNLGYYTAIGAALEFVVSFSLIPAICEVCPALRQHTGDMSRGLLQKIKTLFLMGAEKFQQATISQKRFWRRGVDLLIVASFCTAIPMLFSSSPFQFGSDLNHLFSSDHELTKAMDQFEERRGWLSTVILRYENQDPQEVLLWEKKIKAIPHVKYIESFWGAYDSISLGVEAAQKPWIEFQMRNSGFGKNFFSFDQMKSTVYVQTANSSEVMKIKDEIESICQRRCQVTGDTAAWAESSSVAVKTLFESFALSFVSIVILIVFLSSHHPWKVQAAVILSSSWGPMMLIFLIWYFGIRIDFVLSTLLSILAGLSGDNAIQFLFQSKHRLGRSVDQQKDASLIVALLMAALALWFVFMPFEPLKNFGLFLLLGFILTYIGDVWVLKSLLQKIPGSESDGMAVLPRKI